jgi:Domain of unknown function (DUF5916)/Carbohydrate family 9 binding domain-like
MKLAKLCVLSTAIIAIVSWTAPAAAQGKQVPERNVAPAAGAPPAATPRAEGTLQLQDGQGGGRGPRGGAGRPTLTAVRTAQAPEIDGHLDDAIWRNAALIDTFVQEEPVEGAPATERTEVRVAYDSERLYFGIHAYYSDLSLMRANRSDRDKLDNDDTVTIFLEPSLDYLRGYSFSVNGYGVQRDSMIVVSNAQSNPGGDTSWNVLFASGGQRLEDGWTAEMAIPIKSLRYPSRGAGETHRWGFQVRREIKSKDEAAVWAPVSRNNPNFLSQIGFLTGMTGLSTQRNFELLPTFTAVSSGRLNASTGEYGSDHVEEGGIGLKYGISSNLTFDFTYNPDFSNIESETQQIEINQRFPINYPELRPFFLEGREIYEIPGRPQPVQTRRIVDPRYGAKLTGKLGSRTSIGMFLADDEAPGKVDDITDPAYGKTAKNVLGRVKYELYRNSHVGVIFTDREFMEDHSRLVMFDTALRMGETGNFGWRFYKSDREESAVQKDGWASEISIRRNTRNLNWAFIANGISPEFGNQLSFVQRADQIQILAPQLSYKWYPESWILNWGPGFNMPRIYDFNDHSLQNADYQPNISFAFAKNITLNANINRSMERYRDIDFDKTRWTISGNVNTSRKVLFSANVSNGDQIRFVPNPFLGRLLDYGVTATFRPTSRLESRLQLDGNRFSDPLDHRQEFDVKIMRSTTTYQFTPRLLVRNITELNTGEGSNHTLFQNILVTYRVNSGTVFFVGYDDRFKEGNAVNAQIFQDPSYKRTNRAIFTKLQYLFRSGGAE